jgi:predicted DNA-binding protein
MAKPKKMWNLKATEEFISRLQKTAEVLDRPASQLVREAVNEKIEALSQTNPKVAEALREVA